MAKGSDVGLEENTVALSIPTLVPLAITWHHHLAIPFTPVILVN